MKFYSEVPSNHSDLHNQTKQSDVTDEEFQELFKIPPYKGTFNQIVRFVSYIVFLGPIRCFLAIFFLFVYFLLTCIVPHFKKFFKSEKEFKIKAHKFMRPVIRTVLFFSGIAWINKKGKIDPEARVFVCNHITMIDIVNVLYWIPYSIVANSGLKGNIFIEKTADVFDVVFVDRSTHQNATQQITNAAEDPLRLPIVVFPEGKISNGDALLDFRTGAFVSGQPVQPITLRYRPWFHLKDAMTPSWLHDTMLEYMYQLWSVPFMTLDVHFLPTIHKKGESTPKERAIQAQLEMANDLGTKAINRSNKEIFLEGEKEKKD